MRTIITFTAIVFTSLASLAQITESIDKEVPNENQIIVVDKVDSLKTNKVEVKAIKTEIVRLYKFKNARVKKALSFTTINNKPKMA